MSFFPLALAGPPMYNPLWKVKSHKNPVYFSNTWIICHKCIVKGLPDTKKKVYIDTWFILIHLVKSDTSVLFV